MIQTGGISTGKPQKYIEDAYRLIASKADEPKGFPHPMLIAMTSEALMHMEDTILDAVLDKK